MSRRDRLSKQSGTASGGNRERDALLRQGVSFQQEGRFKEAEHCYQLVLRSDPADPQANNLMGTLAIEADAYDVAIDYLRKALKQSPRDPDIRNNLGNAYVLALEPSEALPHLRKALKARPGFLEATVNLANAYKQLGRAAQARKHYEQAIGLDPDRPAAHHRVRRGADRTRPDGRGGGTCFRTAIEKNAYVAKAFQQLTTVHKLDAGAPEFKKLYELLDDPDLDDDERTSLHHSAGKIQANLKNHDEAFHHFQSAKRMSNVHFDMTAHRRDIRPDHPALQRRILP